MSRVALLLAALLALGTLTSGADARPRKPQRKLRGHAMTSLVRLPGALAVLTRPAAPAVPAAPAAPVAEDPSAPPLPPPPPAPTGSGRSLQVTTDDADPDALRLVLSRTTVLAGSVRITFNNAFAQDPHNLVLEGPGDTVVFAEVPKGEVAVRSAPLAAGAWKLYCGLEGHEARGMVARLTVA